MTISQARAAIVARSTWRAWVALAAVYVLWGSTYTAIQVGVREFPPFLLAGTRYMFAGLLLYLIAGHQGGWRQRPARWRWPSWAEAVSAGVVGLFLLLGGNGLVTFGEVRVHSGLAALMIATVPLWMALLGLALRGSRRLGAVSWAGVVLGMAGVVVLVGPGAGGGLTLLPAVELIAAAVLWSVGSLYAQRAPLARNVLLVSAVEMLVGGLALIVVGLVSGEVGQVQFSRVGLPAVLAYVWLVTGGSLAGYTCYTYALKMLPPTTVATYAYVNPVVALLLGWLILGQGLSAGAGLAAALITLGVVLMVSGPALTRRRSRGRLGHNPGA
ncbi:MAG: EamA family transporter [Candidatus Dormibacteria bacterium]